MTTNTTAVDLHMTLRLFDRAYSSGWWMQVWSWLGKDAPRLLDLNTHVGVGTHHSAHFEGLRVVLLAKIVGSESRVNDFDGAFHPRNRHTEERWRGIALAWMRGVEMPPVELIRIGEMYFVRDGHHRISVAAQLGRREIEAVVTAWMSTVRQREPTDR